MRTRSRLAGIAIAALVLGAGSAGAQGKGHDKDKGRDKRDGDEVRTSTGDVVRVRDPRDITRDRDGRKNYPVHEGRNGRDDRDDRDAREDRDTRDGDGHRGGKHGVPPGLAKKPGHMPPGQYKKRYGSNEGAGTLGDILRRNGYTVTRVVPNGQSQYVYYRLRDGSEQRAIVSPGTDRLQFNNVPATMLQQVLAALYR